MVTLNCESIRGWDAVTGRHVECTPRANGEMRQARCLPAKSRAHRTLGGEKMGYVYGPLPPFPTLRSLNFHLITFQCNTTTHVLTVSSLQCFWLVRPSAVWWNRWGECSTTMFYCRHFCLGWAGMETDVLGRTAIKLFFQVCLPTFLSSRFERVNNWNQAQTYAFILGQKQWL